jgi:hypothetical protein
MMTVNFPHFFTRSGASQMRIHRFVVATLAIAAVAGCKGDKSGHPTGAVVPPLAYVRYFNAVGDTLPIDFRAIDQIEFSQPFLAVPFRGIGLGNYQGYQAGSRKIRAFPNSTDINTAQAFLVDTTLTLTAGSYYTVLHTGFARAGVAPKQGFRVIEDALPTPGANIALRIIHAGANTGALDIYITATATEPLPATPTFANVTYGTVQAYSTRTPGAFVIRGFAAGTTTPALFTNAAPLVPTATATPACGISGNTYCGGADGAGTVFSAVIYGAATAGSSAAITAGAGVNTTPKVVYWIDKFPPGIIP